MSSSFVAEADRSSLQRWFFKGWRCSLRRENQAKSQELIAKSCFKLSVILPRGIHPFPSRTRKLSPAGPMVLHAPSVWERRSLPALNKGQSEKSDWPFPFSGTSLEFPGFVDRSTCFPTHALLSSLPSSRIAGMRWLTKGVKNGNLSFRAPRSSVSGWTRSGVFCGSCGSRAD